MNLRPYFQLCRIPNVFTAFANVLAGVVLVRGGAPIKTDWWLLAATGALYCGGMVLNDFFDREIDAVERPDRPIPSGQVSAFGAGMFGSSLLAVGVGMASWHSTRATMTAIALVVAILAYDAWLKSSRLGPVAMGSCRFLNVALGLSAAEASSLDVWWAPVLAGLFTAAITGLSQHEVGGTASDRVRPIVLALGALAGLLAFAAVRSARPGSWQVLATVAPFFTLVLIRGRQLFGPLWLSAAPPDLGRAIGGGILLMPAIDATIVAAHGSPVWALAVVVVGAPGYLLKRWYYLT